MSELSIYLAGPVRDVDDNGRGWRDDLKEERVGYHPDHEYEQIEWLDPLDKYDPGDEMERQKYDENIVAKDIELLAQADAMLVNLPDDDIETWGTPMEMVYATECFDIPVSLCWQADGTVSPWAQVHANYVCGQLQSALAWLEKYCGLDTEPWVEADEFAPVAVDFANPVVEPPHDVAGGSAVFSSTTIDLDMSDGEVDTSDETDTLTGDEKARALLSDVAALVHSDRDTHGDAVENQQHIGEGWQWYLDAQGKLTDDAEITGGDVGRMMGLLKMSRTAVGEYDVDHDRDVAGYAGIAAACEVDSGRVDVSELTVQDMEAHE